MFVTLTDARKHIPVVVNLDLVLYGYRETGEEVTVLVFGKTFETGPSGQPRARTVGVTVTETFQEIHAKRRMAT
jgi:hypothetical protein